jgi:hypothetical protein
METAAERRVVITTNLGQMERVEVEAVADAIAQAIADPEVSIGGRVQHTMLGALPPELLRVALDGIGTLAVEKACGAVLRMARELWRSKRERTPDPRRILVVIHGPRGEVLSRVLCDEPDGDPTPYDGSDGVLGARPGPILWRHGPKAHEE